MSKISNSIKSARQACKMSQAELAEKVGVSVSAIRAYEQDKAVPPLDRLDDIAHALGKENKYLV